MWADWMGRSLLVCVFLLIFSCPSYARIVRNIQVVRQKVFEPGELPLGTTSLFNSLHMLTRESVVRRDILFKEGEPLDSLLVAETERLLRSRRYLGDVNIRIIAVDSAFAGSDSASELVDVEVSVRDLWTLELSVAPSGGGGAYSVDMEVSEANFRGRGERLKVQYTLSDRRPSGLVKFYEPALFHPHVTSGLVYTSHGDGNLFSFDVGHSFWAITVPWQWGMSYSHQRDNFLFYKQQDPAFEYPFVRSRARAQAARSWGREKRLMVGGSITWEEQEYGPVRPATGVSAPSLADTVFFQVPERTRVGVSAGLFVTRHGFSARTFLDQFGRAEYFPTPMSVGVRGGRLPRMLGSTVARNQWFALAQAGASAGPLMVNLEGSVTYETSVPESEGRTLVHTALKLYLKPAERHLLAIRARHDGWYRSNNQGQMFLGALSGVRGLRARYRDGTRRWFVNSEYRYFSPLQILTVDLGAVVFGDAGQVWNRFEEPRLSDVELTWGGGLRLGLSKLSGDQVLRIDWARGPDGWITTFGFGMYFNLNLSQSMEF